MDEPTFNELNGDEVESIFERWDQTPPEIQRQMVYELFRRLDSAERRCAELDQTCTDLATQVVRFKAENDRLRAALEAIEHECNNEQVVILGSYRIQEIAARALRPEEAAHREALGESP